MYVSEEENSGESKSNNSSSVVSRSSVINNGDSRGRLICDRCVCVCFELCFRAAMRLSKTDCPSRERLHQLAFIGKANNNNGSSQAVYSRRCFMFLSPFLTLRREFLDYHPFPSAACRFLSALFYWSTCMSGFYGRYCALLSKCCFYSLSLEHARAYGKRFYSLPSPVSHCSSVLF